jgi:hypothetical protein
MKKKIFGAAVLILGTGAALAAAAIPARPSQRSRNRSPESSTRQRPTQKPIRLPNREYGKPCGSAWPRPASTTHRQTPT